MLPLIRGVSALVGSILFTALFQDCESPAGLAKNEVLLWALQKSSGRRGKPHPNPPDPQGSI